MTCPRKLIPARESIYTLRLCLFSIGRPGFGFGRPIISMYLKHPNNLSLNEKNLIVHQDPTTATKMRRRDVDVQRSRRQQMTRRDATGSTVSSRSVFGRTRGGRSRHSGSISGSSRFRRSRGSGRPSRRSSRIIGGDL
jgi:hypothetical protein